MSTPPERPKGLGVSPWLPLVVFWVPDLPRRPAIALRSIGPHWLGGRLPACAAEVADRWSVEDQGARLTIDKAGGSLH